MKRILIFNDSLAMGGTEKLLVDLVKHFVSLKCKVTLLLPEPSDNNVLLTEIPSEVSIKYLYDNNTSYWMKKMGENVMIFFPRFFANTKGVRSADYDMAICFKECFYARLLSILSVPKTLWIHNIVYRRTYETRSWKERLAVWLNKKQIRKAQQSYQMFDKTICVSDACKDAFVDVVYNDNTPHKNIEVIYNAIDLRKVVEKSKESIDDLPTGVTKFIQITRPSPEKRIDRLINASVKLKEEGYVFFVYIIGDTDVSSSMTEKLKHVGLDQNFILLGRVDNPYPYVMQSNWLVCSSERESFSLALLEAMALSTPVITTNCGGPANIVDNGKYGILVNNSTQGIYDGMKQVLNDSTLSVKYSAHLDKALARFDYKTWLRKIDEVLDLEM